MKACFPVARDRGLESRVHPHLGSAPVLLLVDTQTGATRAIPNPECGSGHGRCHPLDILADEKLDLMAVSGIGPGALDRLEAAGIRVYQTPRATVGEALDAIARGALPPVLPEEVIGAGFGCGRGGRHGGRGYFHHHGGHGHGPHRFRGGRGA
ncbi:MAG TPA: NifB/NifX family molybdenum-iron cluster-binding protein [Dongiaceae bacterium]|nr:NifB/NifX family molybdenum-iron cluster-binding protein [Dongiaceae bacterium]